MEFRYTTIRNVKWKYVEKKTKINEINFLPSSSSYIATPFNPNQNESEIPSRVLAGRISWPRTIDETTKAFIKKLLIQNADKRLGSGRHGSREVKEQPFFASIKWDDVYARKLKPPIVPNVQHPGDTSCFDQYKEDWRSVPFASDKELELFADF